MKLSCVHCWQVAHIISRRCIWLQVRQPGSCTVGVTSTKTGESELQQGGHADSLWVVYWVNCTWWSSSSAWYCCGEVSASIGIHSSVCWRTGRPTVLIVYCWCVPGTVWQHESGESGSQSLAPRQFVWISPRVLTGDHTQRCTDTCDGQILNQMSGVGLWQEL